MSRRHRAKKRETFADPNYESILVQMIVNRLMKHGKKQMAYRIVYDALNEIKKTTNENPMKTLDTACQNVTPLVEVKAKRFRGSALQVPIQVKAERGTVLAIQWILAAARSRPGSNIVTKLKQELLEAADDTGGAIKKRNEVKRMAEANKAFARFRF